MKYFKGKFRKVKKLLKSEGVFGYTSWYESLARYTKPGALIGITTGFNAKIESIHDYVYVGTKSAQILEFASIYCSSGEIAYFPSYTPPRTLDQIYSYWKSWLQVKDDEWDFKAIATYLFVVRGTELDVVDKDGVLLIPFYELREKAVAYSTQSVKE